MPNVVLTNQIDNKWISILAITCFSILAYGYLYSQNTINDFSFLLGENLVQGFFLWGIFHLICGKKGNKKSAWISFFIILTSLISSDFIGYSQQSKNVKLAISETQKGYSELINSGTDNQGLPKRIENQLDTTPSAKGEFGEFERFMKTTMNQFASLRNDYLLEMEAIGWLNILNPERLKDDKSLIKSKAIIQNAKEIEMKYREKTYALLEKIRSDINNLNTSENMKAQALKGFDKGMIKSRSQIDELWNLEEQTILEFENIINLLAAVNGTWVIQNKQVMFSNEEDLASFNSYIENIKKLAEKQVSLQKQNIASANNKFDEITNK